MEKIKSSRPEEKRAIKRERETKMRREDDRFPMRMTRGGRAEKRQERRLR